MYGSTAFDILERHGFVVDRDRRYQHYHRGEAKLEFRVGHRGHISSAYLNDSFHSRPATCIKQFIAAATFTVEEVDMGGIGVVTVTRAFYSDTLEPYLFVTCHDQQLEKHWAELVGDEVAMPTLVLLDYLQDKGRLKLS